MNQLPMIDDGYTHEACIADAELVFTYRPMPHEERDVVAEVIARQTEGAAATRLLADTIAAHLVAWSRPQAITADEIEKLAPGVFDSLYATLAGSRRSDPFPGTGQLPEAYDEGADLKN